MSKISYAGCPGLPVVILAQFVFEMCVAARNRQKSEENPYFSVQCYPRSLISVSIESQCTISY